MAGLDTYDSLCVLDDFCFFSESWSLLTFDSSGCGVCEMEVFWLFRGGITIELLQLVLDFSLTELRSLKA